MIPQVVAQQGFNPLQAPVIKLIGVGGGGCNAVEQMINADIHGVDFTCVNTDAQALAKYNPDHVIQLGNYITRGLGAGTDPEVGRLAAEEDKEIIAAAIGNTDMLFLTAGMGGGTGTGAIPVIARIARELGILTVAVVTKPFAFEGGKRQQVAETGIARLRENVDSLIVVPNENLLTHLGPNISLIDAFAASNDVLTNAVQSIAELITNPGLINVDFADVKSVMTEMGETMMSTGRGIGEYRARDAAIAATESPLLDDVDLSEARGILANITASSDLSMGEFQIVGEILSQITAENANVVIGTVFDQDIKDEIRVTVVATGLNLSDSRRSGRANSRTAQRNPEKTQKKKRKSLLKIFGSSPQSEKTEQRPARNATEQPAALRTAPDSTYRTQDEIYHKPPVNAPADNVRQLATGASEVLDSYTDDSTEFCKICGNSPTEHTDNCPQNARQRATTPFEFSGFKVEQDVRLPDSDYDVDHLRTANQASLDSAGNSVKIPRKNFHTGPKKSTKLKHIAGVVAGTTILLSVFYFVMNTKSGVNDKDMVTNSEAPAVNLAERKLKAANRRLSVLDD